MAYKYREEIVGKRFLSVSGYQKLKLNKISDWGWRSGVIRASSHKDNKNKDLQVLVEYDDVEWHRREWISIYKDGLFHMFLVEQGLVWSDRRDPFSNSHHKVLWPALTFQPLVSSVDLSSTSQPVEFLLDHDLAFKDYSTLEPFLEFDTDMCGVRDYPELRTEVRRWAELQDGQRILLTTPSVLVGYRVEVYRAEGTTQWYTAVIIGYNEATRDLTVTDDTVLEEHNEDPALVQMRLIGDGVVESIMRGENVGITPRRSRSALLQSQNHQVPPSHRLGRAGLGSCGSNRESGRDTGIGTRGGPGSATSQSAPHRKQRQPRQTQNSPTESTQEQDDKVTTKSQRKRKSSENLDHVKPRKEDLENQKTSRKTRSYNRGAKKKVLEEANNSKLRQNLQVRVEDCLQNGQKFSTICRLDQETESNQTNTTEDETADDTEDLISNISDETSTKSPIEKIKSPETVDEESNLSPRTTPEPKEVTKNDKNPKKNILETLKSTLEKQKEILNKRTSKEPRDRKNNDKTKNLVKSNSEEKVSKVEPKESTKVPSESKRTTKESIEKSTRTAELSGKSAESSRKSVEVGKSIKPSGKSVEVSEKSAEPTKKSSGRSVESSRKSIESSGKNLESSGINAELVKSSEVPNKSVEPSVKSVEPEKSADSTKKSTEPFGTTTSAETSGKRVELEKIPEPSRKSTESANISVEPYATCSESAETSIELQKSTEKLIESSEEPLEKRKSSEPSLERKNSFGNKKRRTSKELKVEKSEEPEVKIEEKLISSQVSVINSSVIERRRNSFKEEVPQVLSNFQQVLSASQSYPEVIKSSHSATQSVSQIPTSDKQTTTTTVFTGFSDVPISGSQGFPNRSTVIPKEELLYPKEFDDDFSDEKSPLEELKEELEPSLIKIEELRDEIEESRIINRSIIEGLKSIPQEIESEEDDCVIVEDKVGVPGSNKLLERRHHNLRKEEVVVADGNIVVSVRDDDEGPLSSPFCRMELGEVPGSNLLRFSDDRSDSGVSSLRSGSCASGDERSGSRSSALSSSDEPQNQHQLQLQDNSNNNSNSSTRHENTRILSSSSTTEPQQSVRQSVPSSNSVPTTGSTVPIPTSQEQVRVWRDPSLILESEPNVRHIHSVQHQSLLMSHVPPVSSSAANSAAAAAVLAGHYPPPPPPLITHPHLPPHALPPHLAPPPALYSQVPHDLLWKHQRYPPLGPPVGAHLLGPGTAPTSAEELLERERAYNDRERMMR